MFTRNWYKAMVYQIYNKATPKTLELVTMQNTITTSVYVQPLMVSIGATPGNYVPSMDRLNTDKTLTYGKTGVIIGSGTTEPTLDDYKLENRITNSATYSASLSTDYGDDGFTLTSLITITNTSEDAFTISECGIFTNGGSAGEADSYLMERTVLETPITIEPGGVGQLTYSVKMNYPT